MSSSGISFLFDLDGTLVDSVYQHVQAWREALHAAGIELSVWRIHRKIYCTTPGGTANYEYEAVFQSRLTLRAQGAGNRA